MKLIQSAAYLSQVQAIAARLLLTFSEPFNDIMAKIPRYILDNHVFLYTRKPGKDLRTALFVPLKTRA
jgi:hypothetical protein